jgi:hypothetical protein
MRCLTDSEACDVGGGFVAPVVLRIALTSGMIVL